MLKQIRRGVVPDNTMLDDAISFTEGHARKYDLRRLGIILMIDEHQKFVSAWRAHSFQRRCKQDERRGGGLND